MKHDAIIALPVGMYVDAYKNSQNVPMKVAELSVKERDGVLVYTKENLLLIYAISYSKDEDAFILASKFADVSFFDEFENLETLFETFALNYECFHYIPIEKLKKLAQEFYELPIKS